MKKCILIVFATLICLGLFALDIISTSEGGYFNWDYATTWYGGVVPGADDNVIVNCNIIMPRYTNGDRKSVV